LGVYVEVAKDDDASKKESERKTTRLEYCIDRTLGAYFISSGLIPDGERIRAERESIGQFTYCGSWLMALAQ
jgi:hypothetical protein